jgi:hypothetical protein
MNIAAAMKIYQEVDGLDGLLEKTAFFQGGDIIVYSLL